MQHMVFHQSGVGEKWTPPPSRIVELKTPKAEEQDGWEPRAFRRQLPLARAWRKRSAPRTGAARLGAALCASVMQGWC